MNVIETVIDATAGYQLYSWLKAGWLKARLVKTHKFVCPVCQLQVSSTSKAAVDRLRAEHESGRAHTSTEGREGC